MIHNFSALIPWQKYTKVTKRAASRKILCPGQCISNSAEALWDTSSSVHTGVFLCQSLTRLGKVTWYERNPEHHGVAVVLHVGWCGEQTPQSWTHNLIIILYPYLHYARALTAAFRSCADTSAPWLVRTRRGTCRAKAKFIASSCCTTFYFIPPGLERGHDTSTDPGTDSQNKLQFNCAHSTKLSEYINHRLPRKPWDGPKTVCLALQSPGPNLLQSHRHPWPQAAPHHSATPWPLGMRSTFAEVVHSHPANPKEMEW